MLRLMPSRGLLLFFLCSFSKSNDRKSQSPHTTALIQEPTTVQYLRAAATSACAPGLRAHRRCSKSKTKYEKERERERERKGLASKLMAYETSERKRRKKKQTKKQIQEMETVAVRLLQVGGISIFLFFILLFSFRFFLYNLITCRTQGERDTSSISRCLFFFSSFLFKIIIQRKMCVRLNGTRCLETHYTHHSRVDRYILHQQSTIFFFFLSCNCLQIIRPRRRSSQLTSFLSFSF